MAHSEKEKTGGAAAVKPPKKRRIFLLAALALLCIGTAAYSIFSPYPFGIIRDYIKSIDESGIENPSKIAQTGDGLDSAELSLNSSDVFSFLILGPYDDTGEGKLIAEKCAVLSINSRSSKVSLNTLSPDFCDAMQKNECAGKVCTETDAQTLVDGIDSTLDFKLDGYMLLSAEDTVKILDAAGGVSIQLSQAEKEGIEAALDDADISLDSGGCARLSGAQALAYLRLDESIEMAAETENRMQAVLLALKISANELGLIDTAALGQTILDETTSNITESQFTQLFIRSPGLLKFRVTTGTLPLPDDAGVDAVRLYLYDSIYN